MKIRHFSIYGIWPAIGFIAGGAIAISENAPRPGAFFITFGLVFIVIWFVWGLFKGSP